MSNLKGLMSDSFVVELHLNCSCIHLYCNENKVEKRYFLDIVIIILKHLESCVGQSQDRDPRDAAIRRDWNVWARRPHGAEKYSKSHQISGAALQIGMSDQPQATSLFFIHLILGYCWFYQSSAMIYTILLSSSESMKRKKICCVFIMFYNSSTVYINKSLDYYIHTEIYSSRFSPWLASKSL